MALNDLMIDDGAPIYYDPDFRVVLEDHMAILRTASTTRVINVTPSDAYRFEYDLYGYLRRNGIPAQLHWPTMRLNGMTSPEEFGSRIEQILVPDAQVLERMRQSHMTTRRVT